MNLPAVIVRPKKKLGQKIKRGAVTGIAIIAGAMAVWVMMGEYGDSNTRRLVKVTDRLWLSPDRVWTAVVVRGGKGDPAYVCWGMGHPIHPCVPGIPDRDMPPQCIRTLASYPPAEGKILATMGQIRDPRQKWAPPYACPLTIGKIPLPPGLALIPPPPGAKPTMMKAWVRRGGATP